MKRSQVMATIGVFAFLISFNVTSSIHASDIETVKVFTTSSLRVVPSKTVPAEIIKLDEGELLIRQLGSQLPNNQAAAEKEVFRRMATEDGKALVEQIGSVYDGVVEAWSLGITKLPAILIEDRYVVYGIYNVDDAIKTYRSKQK